VGESKGQSSETLPSEDVFIRDPIGGGATQSGTEKRGPLGGATYALFGALKRELRGEAFKMEGHVCWSRVTGEPAKIGEGPEKIGV